MYSTTDPPQQSDSLECEYPGAEEPSEPSVLQIQSDPVPEAELRRAQIRQHVRRERNREIFAQNYFGRVSSLKRSPESTFIQNREVLADDRTQRLHEGTGRFHPVHFSPTQ